MPWCRRRRRSRSLLRPKTGEEISHCPHYFPINSGNSAQCMFCGSSLSDTGGAISQKLMHQQQVSCKNKYIDSYLSTAIQDGSIHKVHSYLYKIGQQTGLNQEDALLLLKFGTQQDSILHVVCRYEAVTTLIRDLIQNGACINAKNKNGYTPLMVAAEIGNESCAQVLLNVGASAIPSTPMEGFSSLTAADLAIAYGHPNIVFLIANARRTNLAGEMTVFRAFEHPEYHESNDIDYYVAMSHAVRANCTSKTLKDRVNFCRDLLRSQEPRAFAEKLRTTDAAARKIQAWWKSVRQPKLSKVEAAVILQANFKRYLVQKKYQTVKNLIVLQNEESDRLDDIIGRLAGSDDRCNSEMEIEFFARFQELLLHRESVKEAVTKLENLLSRLGANREEETEYQGPLHLFYIKANTTGPVRIRNMPSLKGLVLDTVTKSMVKSNIALQREYGSRPVVTTDGTWLQLANPSGLFGASEAWCLISRTLKEHPNLYFLEPSFANYLSMSADCRSNCDVEIFNLDRTHENQPMANEFYQPRKAELNWVTRIAGKIIGKSNDLLYQEKLGEILVECVRNDRLKFFNFIINHSAKPYNLDLVIPSVGGAVLHVAAELNKSWVVDCLISSESYTSSLLDAFDVKQRTPLMVACENDALNSVQSLLLASCNTDIIQTPCFGVKDTSSRGDTLRDSQEARRSPPVSGFLELFEVNKKEVYLGHLSNNTITFWDGTKTETLSIRNPMSVPSLQLTDMYAGRFEIHPVGWASLCGYDDYKKAAEVQYTSVLEQYQVRIPRWVMDSAYLVGRLGLWREQERNKKPLPAALFSSKSTADLMISESNGYSALSIAMERKNVEIVELLIKHGANIGIIDGAGLSPLHRLLKIPDDVSSNDLMAETAQVLKILPMLLNKAVTESFPVNQQDQHGTFPIMLAATFPDTRIMKTLIAAGADVKLVNNDGDSALCYAAKAGCIANVQYLIEIDCDEGISENQMLEYGRALLMASKHGNAKAVKSLVHHRAPIDLHTKQIVDALGGAASHEAVLVVLEASIKELEKSVTHISSVGEYSNFLRSNAPVDVLQKVSDVLKACDTARHLFDDTTPNTVKLNELIQQATELALSADLMTIMRPFVLKVLLDRRSHHGSITDFFMALPWESEVYLPKILESEVFSFFFAMYEVILGCWDHDPILDCLIHLVSHSCKKEVKDKEDDDSQQGQFKEEMLQYDSQDESFLVIQRSDKQFDFLWEKHLRAIVDRTITIFERNVGLQTKRIQFIQRLMQRDVKIANHIKSEIDDNLSFLKACKSAQREKGPRGSAVIEFLDLFYPDLLDRCKICDCILHAEGTIPTKVCQPNTHEHFNKPTCHHTYCQTCLKTWIDTKLADRSTNIICPEDGCKIVMYADDVQRIGGTDAYRQFTNLRSENYRERLVEILESQRNSSRIVVDGEDVTTTVKPCPQCYVLIHRYQGCDSMLCSCGHRFNWAQTSWPSLPLPERG